MGWLHSRLFCILGFGMFFITSSLLIISSYEEVNMYNFNISSIRNRAFDLLSPKSEIEWTEETFAEKMSRRRRHLQSVCKLYRDTDFNYTYPKQKFVDPRSKSYPILGAKEHYWSTDARFNQKVSLSAYLVIQSKSAGYCWNHKVGSSTWMGIFSLYYGKAIGDAKLYTLQYKMSPKTLNQFHTAVRDYNNIIVIRHPIHRLISAYRDRVYGLKNAPSFYRTVASSLKIKHTNIIQNYTREKTVHGKTIKTILPQKIYRPSFSEFIQYVVQSKYSGMDNHWKLYSHHCSPCIANFTYILEMDDVEEQVEALNTTGLWQDSITLHANPTGNTTSSNTSQISKYVSQLSCELLRALYEKYLPDFLLFEYSIAEYVLLANESRGCTDWEGLGKPFQEEIVQLKT